MRIRLPLVGALLLSVAASLAAHDLFLKPESYFVPPNTGVRIRVLNGTFTTSEAAVKKDRVRDISVVSPSGVSPLDTSVWEDTGKASVLSLRTGESGTYVVAASIRPRELKLEAADFNKYLATDGVPDILDARRRANEIEKPARERYSKHVKAVLQVGPTRTAGYDTALGYPAELVPLDNPYELKVGRSLRLRALVDGKPVPNLFVVAGGRTPAGRRLPQRTSRTDSAGVVRLPIPSRGHWYVKFIHMVRAAQDTTIDYESKWATLTFQVR